MSSTDSLVSDNGPQGSFNLQFTYVLGNQSTSNSTYSTWLRFLATGEMDTSSPFNSVNNTNTSRILAPAMAHSGLTAPEFWELIGRFFSILYWLYLADLGQVSAINNDYADVFQSYAPASIVYSATNNIFVNQSLYQNYLKYMQIGQFPFNWAGENPFAHFSETLEQPLQPTPTMFLQSYSCQQLQLKSPISLFIFVIISDYPFLVGGYSLFIWVASQLEKRQRDSKTQFSFSRY